MKQAIPIDATDDAIWFDVRFLYASHGAYWWRIRNAEGGTAYESRDEGYSWDDKEDVMRLPLKARHLVGRALQIRASAATGNGQSDMVGVEIRLAREVEPSRAANGQRIQETRQTARLDEGQIAHFDFVLAFEEKPS